MGWLFKVQSSDLMQPSFCSASLMLREPCTRIATRTSTKRLATADEAVDDRSDIRISLRNGRHNVNLAKGPRECRAAP